MAKKNSLTFQNSAAQNERPGKVVRNTAQKTVPFLEMYDNGMLLVSRTQERGVKGKRTVERYSIMVPLSRHKFSFS